MMSIRKPAGPTGSGRHDAGAQTHPEPGCRAVNTGNLIEYLDWLFAHFDAAFARAKAQVCVTLGGARIDCRTSIGSYAETLRIALADGGAPIRADCRILVACADTLGLPGLPAWDEPFFLERAVEAALSATRYRLHHMAENGFWQFYDRETGRGLQLQRTARDLPPWDGGSPLRNFLHWHMRGASRALVHAGSLGIGGRGVLLSGPGGSGKSGTVLAGILHGLETVGDDYVLVDVAQATLARPLFRTLKTDPAGYARLQLQHWPAVRPGLNWQGKHQFTLGDIGAAPQTAGLVIDAICLPRVGTDRTTRFDPVSPKQAFLAIAPSGVSQIPGDRDVSFGVCAALARRLPAYQMTLGPDPGEIAQAMTGFIEDLRP